MDTKFLSGDYFIYCIIWTTIIGEENEEIYFTSHQIMWHSVVGIFAIGLLTWRAIMINSKIIIGFWKRALENAKDYREYNEYAILLDEETNHELSDAYSSANNN